MNSKTRVLLLGVLLSIIIVVCNFLGVFEFPKSKVDLPELIVDTVLSTSTNDSILSKKPKFIIDSNDEEIIFGDRQVPDSIKDLMVLVNVEYWGYDSIMHKGQIVVNKSIEKEVSSIFRELFDIQFPIEKVIPVSHFNWDDDSSMFYNNSSSFNYRKIKNSNKLSEHSLGLAIDINPKENPHIDRFGKVSPSNAEYNTSDMGTIYDGSECYNVFSKYGWKWGGHWRYSKDYQHFSKSGR